MRDGMVAAHVGIGGSYPENVTMPPDPRSEVLDFLEKTLDENFTTGELETLKKNGQLDRLKDGWLIHCKRMQLFR